MKISAMEVHLIGYYGTDLSVVNAARVSFHKQSEELSERDSKLIAYLAKNKHHSPFNHAFLSFKVKAPIFVARQLVKHKFLPWNEVSRRYVDEEPEFYLPQILRARAENVKQGSSELQVIPKGKLGKCPNCNSEFLSNGNTQKFCGKSCQSEYYRKTPIGWRETKWSRLKVSAERRNLDFSISKDDIIMPRYCPYLNLELDYTNTQIQDNSPSVDRIDNSKGYIPGNIQTISSLANKMKANATTEQLKLFSTSLLRQHYGILVPENSGILGVYQAALDEYNKQLAEGVCPEQAREVLPLGVHTEWWWSGTLGAFLDMLKLRLDPHTQQETREVAQMIAEKVKELFPVSYESYLNAD